MSPSREIVRIADGYSFLEGPRWHEGALYVSDFYSGRVLRFSDDRVETVCTVPQQPSGLGFAPDGALLVVSMLDKRLMRLDGDELRVVADMSTHCAGPANDMVVDALGRAYVGNFGRTDPLEPTVLVRCDPDGRVTVVADEVVFPNGSAITPDGSTLIVAESYAARISAWTIAPDGTLSDRRTFAQFGDAPDYLDIDRGNRELAAVPDGICLDADGRLWVADARGHGVWLVEDGGHVADFIDTAPLATFAVALGGSDERTLYICAAPPDGTFDPETENRSVLLSTRVDVGAARPPHPPV